jgi:hypothetical protein
LIGLALVHEDLSVMDEAIDQRHDAGGVWENLTPFGKGPVGSHHGTLFLIASTDELEEKIGMAVGI